jgi:hypothetical protein
MRSVMWHREKQNGSDGAIAKERILIVVVPIILSQRQADEELEPAEAEEIRSKEAYLAACSGKGAPAASSASAAPSAAAAADPYAFLKADKAAPQPPPDDDFM